MRLDGDGDGDEEPALSVRVGACSATSTSRLGAAATRSACGCAAPVPAWWPRWPTSACAVGVPTLLCMGLSGNTVPPAGAMVPARDGNSPRAPCGWPPASARCARASLVRLWGDGDRGAPPDAVSGVRAALSDGAPWAVLPVGPPPAAGEPAPSACPPAGCTAWGATREMPRGEGALAVPVPGLGSAGPREMPRGEGAVAVPVPAPGLTWWSPLVAAAGVSLLATSWSAGSRPTSFVVAWPAVPVDVLAGTACSFGADNVDAVAPEPSCAGWAGPSWARFDGVGLVASPGGSWPCGPWLGVECGTGWLACVAVLGAPGGPERPFPRTTGTWAATTLSVSATRDCTGPFARGSLGLVPFALS